MPATHVRETRAVDDREVEAELLAHLLLPLDHQARRADDDDASRTVTQQQLLDHEPGLDRLAETHVVSEQEVGARSGERSTQRLELVRLDGCARPERRLEGLVVGTRHRTPAHGVDDCAEKIRVVEAARLDMGREALVGQGRVAHLELPDDRELLAQPVLVDRLERDDVLGSGPSLVGGATGQPLILDVGDGPGRPPNLDHLPRLGYRRHSRQRLDGHGTPRVERAP